jgi:hypothetical protein
VTKGNDRDLLRCPQRQIGSGWILFRAGSPMHNRAGRAPFSAHADRFGDPAGDGRWDVRSTHRLSAVVLRPPAENRDSG